MAWSENLLRRRGWDEEKLKQLEKFATEREKRRLAKAKRLVRVLAIIASLGLIAIVVEMITRDRPIAVSINFLDQKGTVAEWRRSGFVISIDDSASRILIDEILWSKMTAARKHAVTMLLRAYYTERSGGNAFRLRLVGNSSKKLLVIVDSPEAITK